LFDIIRFLWRPQKTQSALTFEKLGGYQLYQQAKSRVIHRTCGRFMVGERYCLQKYLLWNYMENISYLPNQDRTFWNWHGIFV
jgi:hypothetical protein